MAFYLALCLAFPLAYFRVQAQSTASGAGRGDEEEKKAEEEEWGGGEEREGVAPL